MTKPISIALAQINVTVGDLAGNAEKILSYYKKAKEQGADLILTPESSVTGYSPEDLVLMAPFRKAAMEKVHELAAVTKGGPALIVGSPWEEDGKVYNAAIMLDDGKIFHVQKKTVLPNHGVFDERRIYAPGKGSVVSWRGVKLGILICEDVWSDEAPRALKDQGAEIFLVINASPFSTKKRQERQGVCKRAVSAHKLPLVYLNIIGGQDDIIFDGGSFVLNEKGEKQAQMPEFVEALAIFPGGENLNAPLLSKEECIWETVKLGLRDYTRKNGFSTVMLGLSGGIDSALTAAIAVDALGKEHVKGVLLPSPYSSGHSVEDATESAKLLGIETLTVPIEKAMQAFTDMLTPVLNQKDWMNNLMIGGNLQARLRGVTLMALSNRYGWMLLSTGNKSEIAVGYTTLYGDSCGSYNLLKDLYKTEVYAMARWRNAKGQAIPKGSLEKPPSAELAPGQLDSDQLPSYDLLDKILYHHIEERLGVEEIIAKGFDEATVKKVLHLVLTSEYKRRQSCPGPKISTMLFGKDRRFPMTNKF